MTMYITNINHRQLPKYGLWLLLATVTLLGSCKKKLLFPGNVGTIRFEQTNYTIQNNALDPIKVVLPLSLPLEEDATAVITIDDQSTAQATEYTTNPGIPAEGLVVKLAKGATEASFEVSSLNNFEGERTLVLKLTKASGGLTVANANASTVITIKGNPIILPEIRLSETGIAFGNVVTGTTTASTTYMVMGTKLTSDISVTSPANFEISLDDVTYGHSLTIPFDNANMGGVTVYVRFLATTGENKTITGDIVHTSVGVTDVHLNVSGVEYGNTSGGVLLLKDDFNYGAAAGNLKALTTNWTVYSGTVNPIKYGVPGLSFSGYAGSGVGGAVVTENGSGSREDMIISFTPQNSGSIYVAQLINIASAPSSSPTFFTSLVNATSGPQYFNRLFVKDNGGSLNIGLGKTSTSSTYASTNYSYGTTYLVVTRYDFAGTSYMYILSPGAVSAVEPLTASVTNSGGADPASLLGVCLRQSTESPLTATFDGLRVATSWKEAVGL